MRKEKKETGNEKAVKSGRKEGGAKERSEEGKNEVGVRREKWVSGGEGRQEGKDR